MPIQARVGVLFPLMSSLKMNGCLILDGVRYKVFTVYLIVEHFRKVCIKAKIESYTGDLGLERL